MTDQDFSSMSGPDLVRAYNALAVEAQGLGSTRYQPTVQRFSDRAAGLKRCEALASSVRALRASAAAATTPTKSAASAAKAAELGAPVLRLAPVSPAAPLASPSAALEKALAGVKPAKLPRGPGGGFPDETAKTKARGSKSAGAELTPVRAGTARARVVEAGIKCMTVEAAARHAGVDRKTLMIHLACLRRDCGIGYDVTGGRLALAFPAGKGPADAFKK